MNFKKLFHLNFILWLFFYIALFFYILQVTSSTIDFDLPWHLRIGEQITREHAAPTIDYYNHTLLGRQWVDHEWLFNFIFYFSYNHFGYFSLNILFALLLTITFVILRQFTQSLFINKHLHNNSKPNLTKNGMLPIMLLQIYAIIALSPLIGIRMQTGGNLLFLLLLVFLGLFDNQQKKIYLLLLAPLFTFWANLHGSFLVGLAILWAWLGLKTITPLLKKYSFFNKFELASLSKNNLFFSYLTIITATLSTLLNPYGYHLYSFLNTYRNTFYLTKIAEWRPFYYMPILYNQLIIMAIFAAILILILYTLNRKNSSTKNVPEHSYKPSLWFIFSALLFFILSLKSKRHFPLFLLSSFPLIIQFIYFEFNTGTKNIFSKIFNQKTKLSIVLIFFGFCIFNVYFLHSSKIIQDPLNNKLNRNLPYSFVEFFDNNQDLRTKTILNPYSWGGYFLWMMPDVKLFIDGRMPQIEYNNHSLLEEYSEFFEEDKLEQKLLDHNIDLVILEKDKKFEFNNLEKKFLGLNEEEINNEPNYLHNFLEKSDKWEEIYENNLGAIYLLK